MIYRHLLVSLPLIFPLLLILSNFSSSLPNASLKRQNSSRVRIIPSLRISKDDFYNLLVEEDGGAFVDKSLFLKDFLKVKEKISRITRPKGWGKTTNLNMVRRFLEIELNSTNGRPLPRENCSTYRLFAGGEITYDVHDDNNNYNDPEQLKIKLLKPLKVAEHADIMESQCRFPVIFINFQQVVGKDYAQIELKLKKLVTNLFKEHRYIRLTLDQRHIDQFDAYINGEFGKFELEHSLLFLSRLMHARFKRQVYLLVDDYDRPITSVFYHLVKECRKLYRNMSDTEVYKKTADSFDLFKVMCVVEAMIEQCLKDNKAAVKHGLVTGVFDINLSLFGAITEVRSYSLLDQTYSAYFGFTDNELDLLLENIKNAKNSSKGDRNENVSRREDYWVVTKSSIKEWYAYNFLGYTIYNPSCVRSFLANGCKFDYYWTTNGFPNNVRGSRRLNGAGDNTGYPIEEDVLSSDAMQEGLQNLTGREVIYNDYRTRIRFDFLAGDFKILLFSGYLNPTLNGFVVTDLAIPNREIDRLIKSKISAWVCDKFDAQIADVASMAARLSRFEADDFADKLATVLRNGPAALSDMNAISHIETNILYSGLMKTLTFFAEENYRIENNKISDPFKPSIVLVSKSNADNTGNCTNGFGSVITIDYKTIVDADELKNEANIAWQKIADKMRHEYMAQYSHRYTRLMNMVLVFCGKKFEFEYKIFHR